MATLFIASGPNEGHWFPLGKKSLVIGRDEGLIAQVTDDGISRKHLTVGYDADSDSHFARDMNSKNGVFVNDSQITQNVTLKHNDLIRIGQTLLLFVTEDFQGKDNALNYYRKRGERVKDTVKLRGESAAEMLDKLKNAVKSADKKPGR